MRYKQRIVDSRKVFVLQVPSDKFGKAFSFEFSCRILLMKLGRKLFD